MSRPKGTKVSIHTKKARFICKMNERFGEGKYELVKYENIKEPCEIRCLRCGSIRRYSSGENALKPEKICECETWDFQRFKYEQKVKLKYNEEIRILEFHGAKSPFKFICCVCLSIDGLNNAENIFQRSHVCKHCFKSGARGGTSEGEIVIEDFLVDNNIYYKKQFIFKVKDKSINRKRFDFALFNDKKLINPVALVEFDGKQHFIPSNYFGGEQKFEEIQYSDSMKEKYCKENNYPLLRIRYDEMEQIQDRLTEFIEELNLQGRSTTIEPTSKRSKRRKVVE